MGPPLGVQRCVCCSRAPLTCRSSSSSPPPTRATASRTSFSSCRPNITGTCRVTASRNHPEHPGGGRCAPRLGIVRFGIASLHGPGRGVAHRWPKDGLRAAECSALPSQPGFPPHAQPSQPAIASVSHLEDRREHPGGRPSVHPLLPAFGRGPGGDPAVQSGPALAKSCNPGRATLCPAPKDGILEGENALPSTPTPSQVFPPCTAQPALCTALPALPCAALPALPPLAGSFPPLSLLAAILGSRMLQGALKAKCFRFSACGMASADPKAGC